MPPPQDDNRPHVVIIGAGAAGCSLAYELSKQPVKVTLLEAGTVGQGASGVPVALLNPHRGRTARASDLDLAGLAAMRDLTSELRREGLDSGVHLGGVLRVASNAKQADKWRSLAGATFLTSDEVPAPYHAPFGGLLIEDGGWLEPDKFLTTLVLKAKQRGVSLLENHKVEHLSRTGEGWRVVAGGKPFKAARVVLCVGATVTSGLRLPVLERLAGDIVRLETDFTLPLPLAGAVYGAQKEGDVFVGGNHRAAGEADPDAAERLQRSASWFVKDLGEARLASVWTGVRAKQEGNEPLVAELEPDLWFYGALAGRGFLCASYLSRRLAQRLL